VVREAQLHVLVLEQLLILTRNRVTGLRQNLDERRLVELVQRADDRQPADELGNEAVLDQVLGFDLLKGGAEVAVPVRLDVGLETQRLLARPALDDLLEADERAAA